MRPLLYTKLFLLVLLTACGGTADDAPTAPVVDLDEVVLIDVRTDEEFANWHAPMAIHLPYDRIDQTVAAAVPDKDTPIVLHCRSGRRSGIARETLLGLGYTDVTNLGGLEELKAELQATQAP